MKLTLKVIDKENKILFENSGEDFVDLVCKREYQEGDKILLESSEKNIYVNWQVDDAMGSAFVYLSGNEEYIIPFGEKRDSCSPKVFIGEIHYLYAESATEAEIGVYRNLALNPVDQHNANNCFPHVTANVETRGEAAFAAKNTIDGVRANLFHGSWPYTSWGINKQDDALMKLDFGRKIRTDKIVLYIRADFPHDNWWTKATISFSDGSSICFPLEKTAKGQVVTFEEREISWLELSNLIKADGPSPYPALTQIEVYGRNVI